jgi:hypothetical protein
LWQSGKREIWKNKRERKRNGRNPENEDDKATTRPPGQKNRNKVETDRQIPQRPPEPSEPAPAPTRTVRILVKVNGIVRTLAVDEWLGGEKFGQQCAEWQDGTGQRPHRNRPENGTRNHRNCTPSQRM